jgi:hypothetical protein
VTCSETLVVRFVRPEEVGPQSIEKCHIEQMLIRYTIAIIGSSERFSSVRERTWKLSLLVNRPHTRAKTARETEACKLGAAVKWIPPYVNNMLFLPRDKPLPHPRVSTPSSDIGQHKSLQQILIIQRLSGFDEDQSSKDEARRKSTDGPRS